MAAAAVAEGERQRAAQRVAQTVAESRVWWIGQAPAGSPAERVRQHTTQRLADELLTLALTLLMMPDSPSCESPLLISPLDSPGSDAPPKGTRDESHRKAASNASQVGVPRGATLPPAVALALARSALRVVAHPAPFIRRVMQAPFLLAGAPFTCPYPIPETVHPFGLPLTDH